MRAMSVRTVLGVAALSAIFWACGSDGSSSSSAGDGGLLPDGARASGSGGGGGGGGGSGGSQPGGLITVWQSTSSGGGNTGYDGATSAVFSDGATLAEANGCRVTTAGACSISICDKTDGGIATGSLRSAGNIQVMGTATPASLSPKADKSYETFHAQSTNVPFLAPGAELDFKATGADVPAFSGKVKVGGSVQVTSPQISLFGSPLPKDRDAVFAWTGAGDGDTVQILFTANAATDGAKTATVTCSYTGSSGVVPKAALDALASPGGIAVGTANTTKVTAGDYTVAVTAWLPSSAGLFTK